MEETIELKELIGIFLKRKIMIAIIAIFFTIISIVYTVFILTPVYKSDTTLMVNNAKGLSAGDIASSFSLGDINLNQKLVITYGEIVKSRIVLEQVIDRLDLDMSYGQLLSNIQSSPVGSTEILRISVESLDPDKAAVIANEIADVFVKEVMRILKVNNVETIDKAIPNENPINYRLVLNVVIALVLGIMVGVFLAFLLEYLDQTIKTESDVEKYLGVNVVGSIADFSRVDNK